LDISGINRQQGYTTRLAVNCALHLMQGKVIVGVVGSAAIRTTLISKIYAVLASLNLSGALNPVVASCYYKMTNGGSIEFIIEGMLTSTLLMGKRFDCVFSDPGRLTIQERAMIIPHTLPTYIFLDEHNVKGVQHIITSPSINPPVKDTKRITSR
jgi:hypothetical protein